MVGILRRAIRALLLTAWLLAIPALVALLLHEHLLSRTPAAILATAVFEGERRAWVAAALLLCTMAIAFYWRGHLSRLWMNNGVDALRTAAPPRWHSRPLIRAGVALGALGLIAVAVLTLKSNHQLYRVQSLSMLPVLKAGDEVAIDRRAYASGRSVRRGDLAYFDKVPDVVTDEPIRRVIGLPGDRIEMKRGGFPIINGWEVPTCDVGRYFRWGSQGETNARVQMEFLEDRAYLTVHVNRATRFPEYVVPPGEVFVLADNRNAAPDSRNWKAGEPAGVPFKALLGKVELVLLSKAVDGTVDTAATLRPPGFGFNLSGLDLKELEDGVEACLKARPKVTSPPKPGEVPAPQTNAAVRL
jgi:signal peptidase I